MTSTTASDGIVRALLALAAGDRAGAMRAVEAAAAADPDGRLPVALGRYLAARAAGDVYAGAEALTRFIDGGSNRALYGALDAHLRARFAELRPTALVDVGCGDGRVALAAAATATEVDLVEPSAPLLELAARSLAGAGVRVVRAHPSSAGAFVAGLDGTARWDVAESTFALHTMPPGERAAVLAGLRGHVGRLLVAEFDVPAFADGSAEHAAHCAASYERGLREYDGDEAVAQGFLMPVLAGQFEPGAVRHTHEQPASAWVAELRAAGFADVSVHRLLPYWWADAVVLEAIP